MYQLVYQTLATKSPQLHKHLSDPATIGPDFDTCLNDIFMTLFTRQLSLDDCARLWDIYVFEGDGMLIHAAVALLLECEMSLLGTRSTTDCRKVLEGYAKRIPQPTQDNDAFIRRVRDITQ